MLTPRADPATAGSACDSEDQAWTVRRRHMSRPPASRARPPITPSSSTSAPVNGRLDEPLPLVDEPATPEVLGSAAVAAAVAGAVEFAATVGTTTGQVGIGPPPEGVTVGDAVVAAIARGCTREPGDHHHRCQCQPRSDGQATCPDHDLPSFHREPGVPLTHDRATARCDYLARRCAAFATTLHGHSDARRQSVADRPQSVVELADSDVAEGAAEAEGLDDQEGTNHRHHDGQPPA